MRKFARVFYERSVPGCSATTEFRFDTDRVGIRREGHNVILSPIYEDWDDYFRNAPKVSDDFVEAMSGTRRNLLPLENRESLD